MKKNQTPSIASIQGEGPRTLFCPRCDRDFSTEKLLSVHLDKAHPDYENPFTTED